MRAGRVAVIATATLSAVLFSAPSALAASKTSDAVGGDVTCSVSGRGWEDSTFTCKIRDTKADGHTAAMQYRLHYSWSGNKSEVMTAKNQNGHGTTVTWTKKYAEGVSLEFRAVVLRTFNSYGNWQFLDGERG
ncbi:hypothetical protein [Allokutzneria sp. NRRL B-24872]|uniref:hypothetical protein n=1 Tax=Allokutzneria sp. NRRL B-24872 TaxID=1137961 RepID=UPI000A37A4E1|nr:hypothetical protein [Allokutzneria sp. NRRL B-24872]